jgi:hypothetical protein
MSDDGGIRASDSDRDNVVDILRDAFSAGRLTLEEFDERSSAAFAARTWGDLRALTADLPHQPRLVAVPPARPAAVPGGPNEPARDSPPRRLSPMLPILVLWLGVAATVDHPLAFLPVFVLVLLVLQVASRPARRRGSGGAGGGPGGGAPRGPDGPGSASG